MEFGWVLVVVFGLMNPNGGFDVNTTYVHSEKACKQLKNSFTVGQKGTFSFSVCLRSGSGDDDSQKSLAFLTTVRGASAKISKFVSFSAACEENRRKVSVLFAQQYALSAHTQDHPFLANLVCISLGGGGKKDDNAGAPQHPVGEGQGLPI